MMRNLSFLLLAAAAATGCAADPVDAGDDDGGGGGGGGGGDPQPVPLTPAGKFKVTSEFDLATNAPGTPGTIVNYFINATDDPDDPTKFIVDQVIAALPDGSIKNALMNAAPFVTGYLNDRLLAVAPDFVTTLVNVGDAFGQVTKHFGTLEVLEIDAQGHTTKTVNGLHFVIDSVPMDFMFADEGITETKVENVMVTLEASGKLSVASHVVPMKYGQVLKLAIDKGIIPLIDPSAQNLGDILHNVVNCQAVGQYVYEAIGFGSPSTFESACNSGLTAAGGALYTALDNLDSSALEFTLAGTARGVDRNQDGSMDEVTTGQWTGTLGYAGTPAPLGAAKFFGAKM
ncbi:MAG: hypothetical protein ABI867_37395 [Kofleriaceae bacterium]